MRGPSRAAPQSRTATAGRCAAYAQTSSRAGLAALSSVYRERLVAAEVPAQRLGSTLAAMAAIDEAASRLSRNANETMLLQWLLLHLDT